MTQSTAGKPIVDPAWFLLFLLLALGGCAEPFIVLSGSTLSGDIVDPPPSWADFSDVQIVQLETRPADPYSVNIWMAAIGPDIYIATGSDDTNWTEFIDAASDVRIRIDTRVYELEANRVTDPAERARVATEYVRKYDLDAEDNWVMDGQVFRLDRR